MAGFKTHVTTSTALGIAYGAGACTVYDVPLPACVLAAGLCGISGMLPDLDSASGVPKRESIAFAAAVVPLLLAERLKHTGMAPEYIVLCGGAIYLFIRFVLARILVHFTVHRGMFHSFPACLIAGEIAFLLCGHENAWEHYFNAAAVMIGFMSHLVLDEIWALDFSGGRIRFKSSFGTAMKFWGESLGPNLLTYGLLLVSTVASLGDPALANKSDPAEGAGDQQVATQPDDRQVQ
jgi:LexA-binding, inner membrane-associated putative hydrolase